MGFSLGTVAVASGCRLAALEAVDSTSSEALRRAEAGESGPLWIVAKRQAGGHGRRGRSWTSPDGNLAATFLMTTAVPAEAIATLGFVAGVALHGAVAALQPDLAPRLRLKWPNDLLADGDKLAGILVEVSGPRQGRHAVAVGIGVNVAAAPQHLPYPAASLAGLGLTHDAASLFTMLSDGWAEALALWDAGRGMPAIRDAWLARGAGLGSAVEVSTPAGVVAGTFRTIDEDGRLVLDTAGGMRTISAGDVFFGGAATRRAG